MMQYLKNTNACFYHISTYSSWVKIAVEGLLSSTNKGISVLRTEQMPIINSVITSQLGTFEAVAENDFVLIRIPQGLNNFHLSEIEPDIVLKWTWPL